jgi:hypothetical protein
MFQNAAFMIRYNNIPTCPLSLSSLHNMRKMGIHTPTLFGHIPVNKGMFQWLVLKVELITQAKFQVIDLMLSTSHLFASPKQTVVPPSPGYKVGKKSLFAFQSI